MRTHAMKTPNIRGLLALLPVTLLGCPNSNGKPQPIPPAGVVKSFTAGPALLAAPGDKTTLKWETQDATAVTLDQVGKGSLPIDSKAAAGSLEVMLAKDTLFVLTARGPGGTDSLTTAVTVAGSASGLVFDAVPRAIAAGSSTTLVWSAPGAAAVTIKPVESGACTRNEDCPSNVCGVSKQCGANLDLGGQLQSGSVRVAPNRAVQYLLTADGRTLTVDVTVGIQIFSFATSGPAPVPGQMVTLNWETSGGASLTLKREGAAAPLLTETMATRVTSGSFSETVPATAPVDGLLRYTLELTRGADKVTRLLTVRVGGSVSIDQLLVPGYVRSGNSFIVQWKTTGAERLELWVDNLLVYLAPDAASIALGNRSVTAPGSGTVKVKVIASNSRGAVAQVEKPVSVIGLPTFVSFTADKPTIAAGGEAVVLSWNVTNGRHVRITDNGNAVFDGVVLADVGMVSVLPNRAITTYILNADNGAGDPILPRTAVVTVTAPGVLTFSTKVPAGGQSAITGHTVVGGTNLVGLPNVKKNAAGDAFVDISATGTATGVLGDTVATVVNIGPFSTRIFGRPVSTDSVSISPDGFLVLTNSAQTGPTTPTTPIGTQLFPLSVAVALKDLNCLSGTCSVTWQRDPVGPAADKEERLIIQWTDVALYADSTALSTFQAQIFSHGKVVLAYSKIAPNLTGFGVGVVNSSETDVLIPTTTPTNSDVFTYFSETPPPLPVKVELLPYTALVKVAAGWLEVEGSGLLGPGQVAVTEVNPRPAAAVTNGQWIEITNFTAAPFDLNGWLLDLGGGITHTIASSVVVPANGRALLAQASDLGQPGAGITANYVYGPAFSMAATGSVTLNVAGTPYVKFVWDAVTAPAAGASVQADAPNPKSVYAGGASQATCPSAGATWGAAAQLGTPGLANPVCFPYVLTQLDAGSFESIADAGTAIILGDAGTVAIDDKVYPLTLLSPAKYYGQAVPTVYVGTNGWITTTSTALAVLTNRTLPASAAPIGSIAPFWDNLQGKSASTNSGIYTLRRDPDGTPATGDEYTIISWEDWRCFAATQSLNFQVKLFDNGNIEYHYGTMTGAATTTQGSSATSWLEDRFGKSAATININSIAPGIQPNTGFRYTYAP